MGFFRKSSIKVRLLGSISILIILLVISLAMLFYRSFKKTSNEIIDKVGMVAAKIQSQQKSSNKNIKNVQMLDTKAALKTKAQSIGNFLARLASVPLITLETDVIIEYCAEVCRDQDIVLSYVSDAKGEVQGAYYDSSNKIIESIVNEKNSENIVELIKILKGSKELFEVVTDVVQDGELLGKAVLFVSEQSIKQQLAKQESEFSGLEIKRIKTFHFLNNSVEEIIDKSTVAMNYLLLEVAFVILVIAVIVIYYIVKGILTPLEGFVSLGDKLSAGDLTHRLQITTDDELGTLGNKLNQFIEKLNRAVSLVKLSTETVACGANEIAVSNQSLSTRSQEQASSIEQTAIAVDQITAKIKTNAENAQKANELAQTATMAAEQGGEVVEKTIQQMKEVTASSNKIAEIINTVNEIAFQTNLLALNAAVEAARAGEQGRGFAVVAGEVRNLAGRSAEAAKQIQNLIKDSVQKIDTGNTLVEDTGKTLETIIKNVKNVANNISEISSASLEQTIGIDKVNKAVAEMDDVVQQNASMVEEAAATSENLSGEAQEMHRLMSTFNVRDNGYRSIDRTLQGEGVKEKETWGKDDDQLDEFTEH